LSWKIYLCISHGMATDGDNETPEVSIFGWNRLKNKGWEYKNCRLGQYNRYNPKYKERFKHPIVFLSPGDPSENEIVVWLDILKKCTSRWPNVQLVTPADMANRKRQRITADAVCIRCMDNITSLFDIGNMKDGICKDCQIEVIKERRAKEMEELRNRHQREKIMSELQKKVTSLQCTNNQVWEENEAIRRVQMKLADEKASMLGEKKCMEQQIATLQKEIRALQKDIRDGDVVRCKLQVEQLTSSSLDRFLKAVRELNNLGEVVKTLQQKFLLLEEAGKQKTDSLISLLYYTNDITNGTFVKALVADLYYIGILKLCTAVRGYGTASERVGNIRHYNIKMRQVIETALGGVIPIRSIIDIPLGREISHYTLQNIFDVHGYNFQYAIRDIVIKNKTGRWISAKKDRKILIHLAQPFWKAKFGKFMALTLEKLTMESFIELFLQIWHFYFNKGTRQNSITDETFIDLANHKFYKGVNFRVAFTKTSHGPATNGETDSLQLHTYGDVKEYYWQSPRLVINSN
jgi:hypothetical protein